MATAVVIGKNRLAIECARAILRHGDVIQLAVADPADTGTDGWQPSYRRAADELGLHVEQPTDVNDPAFVSRVDRLTPDFVLSFQAAQILKRPLIQTARLACLNLHFGPLPRYRGVAPIAWAIINGERSTGVTIHHIDPGIDSGDIVKAREVPIGLHDTGRTLYDACTSAAIDLFAESWPAIRSGRVERHPQDPARVLYYNRHSIDFRQRTIAWRADARAIHDWTRALIFPPLQYPVVRHGGRTFEVAAVRMDRDANRGRPGEILGRLGDEVIVAAPGGRIFLGDIRADGQRLGSAALDAAGLVAGAVFDEG
jgi:methionyl-tRNA formyltransferase